MKAAQSAENAAKKKGMQGYKSSENSQGQQIRGW